jgi:hypothetical protein
LRNGPQIVSDPDVWWHLKAGEFILERGNWPIKDAFSIYGKGETWLAYSWLPEIALYRLHKTCGLSGLVLYSAMLGIAIMVTFHRLLRTLQPGVLYPGALAAGATLAIAPSFTPRPWLFSILFFVLELAILLRARRSGNARVLFWLPPLFVLWANTHIQFAVGLAVLALATLDSFVGRARLCRKLCDETLPPPPHVMLSVFVLCVLSTLLTPYHYHLYEAAVSLVGQAGDLQNQINELRSLAFRGPADWAVLAATIAAVFAVGRCRRAPLFLILTFSMALYLGFKCRRDSWIIVIVGLTILAYSSSATWRRPLHYPGTLRVAVAVLVGVLTVGGFWHLGEMRLTDAVAKEYPVRAVKWVQARNYEGPLFNSYNWGGYLIFRLPEYPVSIDGRTMVHGVERVCANFNTLGGSESWKDDPELRAANLVILEKRFPLTSILRLAPQFHLEYEDEVAVVFVRTADGGTRDAVP